MTNRRVSPPLYYLVLLLPLALVLLLATAACGPGSDRSATAATEAPGAVDPWYETPAIPGHAPTHGYSAEQVERGRGLVAFGMCSDCHTPVRPDPVTGAPIPDMSRFLAGHPEGGPLPGGTLGPQDNAIIGPTFTSFLLPFGTTYALNLTPDVDTGSGTWTEKMFVDIFRKGKHLGGDGRPVLPPMPWSFVATLSDDDLVAIFAYLRSLPPVRNYVPSPDVPLEVMWQIDAANQSLLGQAE